jgi:alkanesulfonate monooxygenase SsuD/methylene tetrahydromethanopterin reductase-like flavin-dependent oxidoreductase (luciferase family)
VDPDRDRVGLRVDPRLPGASGGPAGAVEAALVAQARVAEALGIDVLWVAERPTRDQALVPAALPICAAVAAATRRLRVATGLLPLLLHHPLRVAEDSATLDLLSGGRFELGVGLGSEPAGPRRRSLPATPRAERFEEALDLVGRALAADLVEAPGPTWRVPPTPVLPKPATPGGPPLFVGVLRPAAQRRAARRGVGLALPAGASPAPYLEAFAQAHGPPERGAPPRARPRVAWLLGGDADPARWLGELDALRARARGAPIDWIVPLPPRASADELRRLADRVLPALRRA